MVNICYSTVYLRLDYLKALSIKIFIRLCVSLDPSNSFVKSKSRIFSCNSYPCQSSLFKNYFQRSVPHLFCTSCWKGNTRHWPRNNILLLILLLLELFVLCTIRESSREIELKLHFPDRAFSVNETGISVSFSGTHLMENVNNVIVYLKKQRLQKFYVCGLRFGYLLEKRESYFG